MDKDYEFKVLLFKTLMQEFPCLEWGVDGKKGPEKWVWWLAGDWCHTSGDQWW